MYAPPVDPGVSVPPPFLYEDAVAGGIGNNGCIASLLRPVLRRGSFTSQTHLLPGQNRAYRSAGNGFPALRPCTQAALMMGASEIFLDGRDREKPPEVPNLLRQTPRHSSFCFGTGRETATLPNGCVNRTRTCNNSQGSQSLPRIGLLCTVSPGLPRQRLPISPSRDIKWQTIITRLPGAADRYSNTCSLFEMRFEKNKKQMLNFRSSG